MKTYTLVCLISATLCSSNAFAGKAIDHSLQASKHSVLAVAEGAGHVAVVASAVVAVPLLVVGGAVAHSGQAVADALHHDHPAPLSVTEITITVDPAPNKAIQTIQAQH